MKVTKLAINDFRGVRGPLELAVEPRGAVVEGSSGSGKSSIVDALQWVIWGRTPHLTGFEFSEPSDLHFCICAEPGPSDISLELLVGGRRTAFRRTMAVESLSQPVLEGEVPDELQSVSPENVVLRRAELSNFIQATKQQKLVALEQLFGLQELHRAHSEIQRAANRLSSTPEYTAARTRSRDAAGAVSAIIGAVGLGEDHVLAKATELALQAGLPAAIRTAADLRAARGTIAPDTAISPEMDKIVRLQAVIQAALDLLPAAEGLDRIREGRQRLLGETTQRQAEAFRRIRVLALEARQNRAWADDNCPLCGRPVDDVHGFLRRLEQEIADADGLLTERDGLVAEVAEQTRRLNGTVEALHKLMSGDLAEHEAIGERREALVSATASAEQLGHVLAEVTVGEGDGAELQAPWLSPLSDALHQTFAAAQQMASRVARSEEEMVKIKAARELDRLAEKWEEHVSSAAVLFPYDQQKIVLDSVLAGLRTHENAVLTEKLARLSQRVNGFFQSLHPDEGVLELRIETTLDTGERGAEFRANFHGKDVLAPRRVLSEGHLHSLGLCLFLANAEHMLGDVNFLVLDDVVTSLDADHRTRVAELLAEHFGEWQLLIFTHDDGWGDRLQTKCNLRRKHLEPWSADVGAVCSEHPGTARQQAEAALARGRASEAASPLRIYFEHEMKRIAEALKAEMPYLMGAGNEKRMLGDLIPPVQSALKREAPGGQLRQCLGAFQQDAYIANQLAHDRGEATTPPSVTELRDALRKFDVFLSALTCRACKQRPHYRNSERGLGPPMCRCRRPMRDMTWDPPPA